MSFTRSFYAKIASILTSLIAILVLIGWYAKIPTLIQVLPTFVPMQYNTALCFLFLSLACFFVFHEARFIPRVLVIIVFFIAFVTLIQYIFSIDVGLDQLFMKHYITTRSSNPGRMAPNTAVCFCLGSIAAYIFTCSFPSRLWLCGYISIFVIALAFVSIVGYVASIEEAYGWGKVTDMAMHTAIGFFLLGTALFSCCLTKNSFNKYSSWILVPLGFGSLFIALSFIRTIDIVRAKSLERGLPFNVNPFFVYISTIMFIVAVYFAWKLMKNSVSLEEEIFQLQVNNDSKIRTIYYVSHEVRNPLNAVIGFSEPFLEGSNTPKEYQEAFDAIYTASNHIRRVIEDVLALSRYETGRVQLEIQEVTFRTWIEKLEKVLQRRGQKSDITFHAEYPQGFPEKLQIDANKVAQIIINLSENAFKFTPPKGSVTLHIFLEREQQQNSMLVIEVQDTGRGIPLEQQKKVFEPFFQVANEDKKRGLGLGLTICKTYSQLMGGGISFESTEGKGTKFIVKIQL